MEPVYKRRIGRIVLLVYPTERSNLAQGRGRARSGTDTAYRVVAAATKGRNATTLGTEPTLDAARRYVDSYSPRFGLIGR
jgi:hypothetical protein